MKAITLCYDDPNIFGTKTTLEKIQFVENNVDSFMQMCKTQGSTFWVRFLITFKNYIENKFATSHKWMTTLIQHFQFNSVLNYMYISIHKKLIEASTTSVKKFIENFIVFAKNSPVYLELSVIEWLSHLKSSKQLQTVLQNLFGFPDPPIYCLFTLFVCYTIYENFFCALCALFEQWYAASNMTEEEVQMIDCQVIYFLPDIHTKNSMKHPMCFEKYLSSYWKQNLEKMILIDNVHLYFSEHKISGCCDKYDREKSLFNLFHFSAKNDFILMTLLFEEMGINIPDGPLQMMTEVSLKDIYMIKPEVELCAKHKNCRKCICHDSGCPEPFICIGSYPCMLTCEVECKINKDKQEKNNGNFWKTMSVQVFNRHTNKRDVSTLAESFDRRIETYLHVRGTVDSNFPVSALKDDTYCITELPNTGQNFRKAECLNRLRKKLSQKKQSENIHIPCDALKQTVYCETLQGDRSKIRKHETQHGSSKHVPVGTSILQDDACTLPINSSDVFGRVVHLLRYIPPFPIPSSLFPETANNRACSKKNDCQEKSDSKKRRKAVKKTRSFNDLEASRGSDSHNHSFDNTQIGNNKHTSINKTNDTTSRCIDDEFDKKVNENIDREIEIFVKALGLLDCKTEDKKEELMNNGFQRKGTSFSKEKMDKLYISSSKGVTDVDNSLELIGLKGRAANKTAANKNLSLSSEGHHISKSINCDKGKLHICANCQKMEPAKKTYKRCSRCKEENFPVHRYYCSNSCLQKNWVDSHREEHLKHTSSA